MNDKNYENDFEQNASFPGAEPNPYYNVTEQQTQPEQEVQSTYHIPGFESSASYQPFTERVKKPKKKMSTNKKIVLSAVFGGIGGCVLSLILVFALLGTGVLGGYSNATGSNPLKIHVSDAPVVSVSDDGGATVADIIDAVGPAVVGINCETEYTDWFWGTSTQPSSGSGVIINGDGYIITNNHVIENASKVSVTLISGEVFDAKLVGRDSRTDLAVIKIDADISLSYATIGDSSKLRVGDSVIAIGNPLGEEFAGSATKGIISATNRTVNISEKTLTVLQTDAAINSGNSGGALVNMNGEVIGINTAKIADGSVEGMGFSIPSNEFLPVINDLMKNGHVTGRPLIGITGRAITQQLSDRYGYPVGVYVVEVAPFSGAEDAGIRNKDVIIEVNGEKVETIDDINVIRNEHKAGDTIKMKVYRMSEDKTFEVDVVLGEDTGESQE